MTLKPEDCVRCPRRGRLSPHKPTTALGSQRRRRSCFRHQIRRRTAFVGSMMAVEAASEILYADGRHSPLEVWKMRPSAPDEMAEPVLTTQRSQFESGVTSARRR
jgi:hypothetical protein